MDNQEIYTLLKQISAKVIDQLNADEQRALVYAIYSFQE